MANCIKCENKLEFVDRIFLRRLCFSCNKDKLEKNKLEEERELNKQEKLSKQYEKSRNEIQKYIESELNEYYITQILGSFWVYPFGNTQKKPFIFEGRKVINLVIKNDYNVKEVIDKLIDDEMINVESNKILEREKKRNIKEEAEKRLYGKVKTKRKILTEEKKDMVFDKFDSECVVCGKKEGLHIHHKDENSSNNQMNNLVVLCGVCHKKTHMKIR